MVKIILSPPSDPHQENGTPISNWHYELFNWLTQNPQGTTTEFVAQNYYQVSERFRRFAFEVGSLQVNTTQESEHLSLKELIQLNEVRVAKILKKYGTNEKSRRNLVKKTCVLAISRGLGIKLNGLSIKK